MILGTEKIFDSVISSISSMKEVQSIGISGKLPLPKAGESDIDVFIYCDMIPEFNNRKNVINQFDDELEESTINAFEEGHWGVGDYILINGVETWLMYFTVTNTLNEVEAILNGEYPDKLDNYFYPIGRCAMLQNINILYERDNFLGSLKKRLSIYPNELAKILVQHHLEELEDTEDLERAVIRKDVLFYHFAMDLAIDHFLQALFAINSVYFPSRKRTQEFIKNFDIKPERCNERLMEVIKLGSCSESIDQSYKLWNSLVDELSNYSD